MIGKEDNLLNDFEDKYLSKRKRVRCCLILLFIILILVLVTALIIYLTFYNTTTKENPDVVKNDFQDDPYTLDTVLEIELLQARNSFYQFYYNDAVDPKIILPYNLFIPENYTNNFAYPLILFIGDESTYGKEITLPINKTVGGPIWASKSVQNKHNCFVLVPHFSKNIFNNKDEYIKNENLNIIIRLINKIKNEYRIDSNRIYGTGQSMGADALLDLTANNLNLFSAILIIEPENFNKTMINSISTPFTYFASHENLDSYNIQIEIKNYFYSLNISFGSLVDIDPQENIEILNQKFIDLYIKKYKYNFITYSIRKANDNKNEGKHNKIEIYKYGFRSDSVIDWLFSQNKIICDNEHYYSEEKQKCFSKTKKKIYFISFLKNEEDILINILKNISFISEVTIGTPDIIPKMTSNFMKAYDCIIYGFSDSIYSNNEKENEIKSYLESGGSFLVTHDKWEKNNVHLNLLGLEVNYTFYSISLSEYAKISRFGHPIFDSYHDLTDWRRINISVTHTSHKAINDLSNTGRIVMEIDKNIETGVKYDYLTVNEKGKGRIAYWAAGHKNNITNDEEKLFINIISWLTKIQQ